MLDTLKTLAVNLALMHKVTGNPYLGYKYKDTHKLYEELLESKVHQKCIKDIYSQLSKEDKISLITNLFEILRIDQSLINANQNVLFGPIGKNYVLKKEGLIDKSTDDAINYSKKVDEFDDPPILDDQFDNPHLLDDNNLDTPAAKDAARQKFNEDKCQEFLSKRARGPLLGSEDKIKKWVCKSCIVDDNMDTLRGRFDPQSKFCKICCK